MAKPLRAIIVGGGIGGLTAAIGLRQAGVDATVFERELELKPLGAGLNLWSNALRAFQRLGIADQVVSVSTPLEHQEQRTQSGKLIAYWPVGDWGRKLGAPTVGLTRPDLHRVLVDALGEEHLQLGAECTGFSQDDSGVTAHFADGREESGDVLIGADGVRSVVRAQLHGPSEPRYAGITSWRAIFDFDPNHAEAPLGTTRLNWGRGAQFNYYRVGGGSLYWLALAKAPEGETDSEGGTGATLLERYSGFYPAVREIIEATPADRIFRTDIVDHDPIAVWVENRVALLGDAAHAMTPNMAQGAGQAIEDGIVIAKCLRDGDPVEGLRAYERGRKDRALMFVKGSRNSTRAVALSNPVACAVRDAAFRVVMGKIAPRQQQRWMDYEF